MLRLTVLASYCIVLYCIVLYLNTCYSAPTRFPIQRRSRLLRGRWIGVSRRSAWAIASEGLAQGPYAAALRWIRTRNPPAARHRTYPYTTAPQLYCVVLCVVSISDLYTRHKTRDRDRDRDSGVRDRDRDRDSGVRDRDRDETPGPRQFETVQNEWNAHWTQVPKQFFLNFWSLIQGFKSPKSADHLNCINYKEIKYFSHSEIFWMILTFNQQNSI